MLTATAFINAIKKHQTKQDDSAVLSVDTIFNCSESDS